MGRDGDFDWLEKSCIRDFNLILTDFNLILTDFNLILTLYHSYTRFLTKLTATVEQRPT